MTTLAERAHALEPLGFSPREARFLTTVALHSGYCLRRQYAAFSGISNGKNVCEFLEALVARGWADRFMRRADRGHVYHLHTRGIYRALGQEDNRNRRQVSAALVARKLMLLDYVLAHPEGEWLATEADKVALFEERFGVLRRDLPQQVFAAAHAGRASTVRYFLHKLPLGMAGHPPAPHFVTLVMDVRGRAFEQFLTDHAGLLPRLPVWTVVAVAPRICPGLVACGTVFDRFLERRSSALGERPEEVRWYLTTRRAVDHGQWARLSVADIDRFRGLRERLDTPETETLYRDWLTHGEAALETHRPEASGAVVMNAGRLITEVLPFDYSQFGSLPGVA